MCIRSAELFGSIILGEDIKICNCLRMVGGSVKETRDKDGKETFIVFGVSDSIHGNFPSWYLWFHANRSGGALKVSLTYVYSWALF